MKRPPRPPHSSIFTRPVIALMLTGGAWSMLVNLGVFWWLRQGGLPLTEAMTMVFITLVLIEFFKAYSFRSDAVSIFQRPFANTWLNLSILVGIGMLLAVVYIPLLQLPFDTFALSARDWLLVSAAAATIIPVLEATKALVRRGVFGEVV